ncbi:MAG: nucleotidyltransferase domain-containing protein [Oscillochloridaceae bacterium umkhey_bin13]
MVPSEQIQALADQIAAAFQPEQIILFGSYAYGTPGRHSDVDLLVGFRASFGMKRMWYHQ